MIKQIFILVIMFINLMADRTSINVLTSDKLKFDRMHAQYMTVHGKVSISQFMEVVLHNYQTHLVCLEYKQVKEKADKS